MERLSKKEQQLYFIILSNPEGILFLELSRLFEEKSNKSYARSTVMTFINRMMKKGYVRKESVGRTVKLIPLISRDEYIKMEIFDMCNVAFNGDIDRMISFMKNNI